MDRIGRYQVEARIGAGGFGAVYRARDPEMGDRIVAVKVFDLRDETLARQATSATGDAVEVLRKRFVAEARVVQEELAGAPHVVRVYGFDVLDDGRPYYVMPYYERSLRDEIGRDLTDPRTIQEAPPNERPRALGPARALTLLRQVAVALASIHRAGIVHRDLKPANLMYDAAGDVVLVDFGIAKVPDSEASRSRSGVGMGTVAYMAPEQRESAKHVDVRADVYAWGVLAYRVLTGEMPLGRFRDPIDLVPVIPQALNELILRCLEQRAEARPQDGAELLLALDRALPEGGDLPEHSATLAGADSVQPGLRDGLEPLRERIEALLLEHGEIPRDERAVLEAQARILEVDPDGLEQLIAREAERSEDAVRPLRRLLSSMDAFLQEHGHPLPEPVLRALTAEGERAGWDADRVSATVRARAAALAALEPGSGAGANGSGVDARGSSRDGPTGPGAGVRGPGGAPARAGGAGPDGRRAWWTSVWGRAVGATVLLGLAGAALAPFGAGFLDGFMSAAERDGSAATPEVVDAAPVPERQAPTERAAPGGAMARADPEPTNPAPDRARAERKRRLVASIDSDLAARRLSTPAGNNAIEKIEELRRLDEAEADRQFARVLAAYGSLFEGALASQDADRAAGFLGRLSELDRTYDRLPDYREQLAALRAALERRQAEARAEAERRRELARITPETVAIPAGTFRMGCVSGRDCDEDEKPVRTVRVAPFRMTRHEITVGQFRAFVEATDYRTEAERDVGAQGCAIYNGSEWQWDGERDWRSPGFEQGPAHPVVCVSWNDAVAYAEWLSDRTGGRWRLPTESEWEYAARSGSETAYHFGNDPEGLCRYGNVADASGRRQFNWTGTTSCDDGYAWTAPVGSFAANAFGLHDMNGNVWEWTADCWHESYAGGPSDGRAWGQEGGGDCSRRVLRGGSWSNEPRYARSAYRNRITADYRSFFRVSVSSRMPARAFPFVLCSFLFSIFSFFCSSLPRPL
jgi:formylglycine-generating enzyme required for sulfatase activity/serine/threonine protein kinase